jgi:thiol:disulfide interchange protein
MPDAQRETQTDPPIVPAPGGGRQARPSLTNRFILLAIVGVGVLMLWQRSFPPKSAVAWQSDFAAALAEASAAGKPVLVSFSSSGCVYCRRMEEEVISRGDVLAEIARFVPVKVDAYGATAMVERYRVEVLPAYVIVDARGAPQAMIDGFQEPQRFIRFLRSVSNSPAPPG